MKQCPKSAALLAESDNTIIESNSILRFLKPDLCAMVLDGSVRISSLQVTASSIGQMFLSLLQRLLSTGRRCLPFSAETNCFSAPRPYYQNYGFIDAVRQTALKTFAAAADYLRR
jgi:hypothetical protein